MPRLVLFAASLFLSSGFAQGQGQIQWGTDPNQPQGAFGRPTQQPSSSPTTAKPAAAGPVAEPAWPQRFEISPGSRAGFGFIVGQPGRVVVNVQSQGVPLIVSLVKPGGATVDKQGTGNVAVEYNATPEDVKRGVIWGVSMRAAQEQKPAGASSAAIHDKPVRIEVKPAASGTVSVQHPAADLKRAQAELDARAKEATGRRPQPQPGMTGTSVAAQRQLAIEKEVAARHAVMLDQVKGRIPAAVHQKMSMEISSRAQAKALGSDAVSTTKSPSGARPSAFASPATSTTSQADTGTGTSTGPSTGGASPVGGNQPASVAASPAVTSLSVSEGQPGAPVLITGRGFSTTQGEVHVIVAAGRDLIAPVTFWSDTQIFAAVPDVSGVQAFDGQLYVKRGTDRSALVPFRFVPETEIRVLSSTSDRILKDPYSSVLLQFFVDHDAAGSFFGAKGDDEYFLQTRLKNGWVTDSAYLESGTGNMGPYRYHSADAYISEMRAGTASPYLKVHWWMDAFSDVTYVPRVVIRGPKGVPHE